MGVYQEGPLRGQSRRVDGVIDVEKLSVLETCALGWVKEAVSMRVLTKEMDATRLWGKYLRVDVATEEPTSFERAHILIETSVRGRIDEVVEVASLGTMFSIVVQEAELVRVLAIDQYGVEDGAALSEQSQEASVASPRKNSLVEQRGRCGFCFYEIRSGEGLDIVHPLVSIVERDSLGVKVVGDCESTEKYGHVVGLNGVGTPSTTVLGLAGAAAAPVIGSAHRGARKVKSVNILVEALGSPAQNRVIAAARSRGGRGRPPKAVL
ncbi:hypothetical protein V6N12_014101 [Hibiscus sabdariffa]|uniref:Uncharacterized protein n=1 Tax=Hibiscus sabdariffa TaxID=183260 RepID=A0ABR2CXW7_9ROSI